MLAILLGVGLTPPLRWEISTAQFGYGGDIDRRRDEAWPQGLNYRSDPSQRTWLFQVGTWYWWLIDWR